MATLARGGPARPGPRIESGEPELAAAWSDLKQRERLIWWLAMSFVPCLAALLIASSLSGSGLTPRLVVYAAAAWIVSYVAVSLYRNAFRCPRCESRFFERGQLRQHCASCGLPLWANERDEPVQVQSTTEQGV